MTVPIKQLKPIRAIVPTQVTQITQATAQLQNSQATRPTLPTKATVSLQQQMENYKRATQFKDRNTRTFLANYNDPKELNSYIDALTNREAVSKRFGDIWGTVSTASGVVSVLSFVGAIVAAALTPVTGGASAPVAAALAKAGVVAALPAVPAAVDVTIEKGIKPIVAGKPKEALLNTLMNVGETVDAVANPIKGLILEGGEGFIKATGLSSEGRTNYDFDTGFFLTDMLLETVIDPLNWVDLGAGIGISVTTKSVAKKTVAQITDTLTKSVTQLSAKQLTFKSTEHITKKLNKAIAHAIQDFTKLNLNKKLTETGKNVAIKKIKMEIHNTLIRALQEEFPEISAKELRRIISYAGDIAYGERILRSAYAQIMNIPFDELSTDVIKSLIGIQHYSDAFQRFLTKGAFLTSGYGLGVELVKDGFKGIKAWANNFTIAQLKKAKCFNRTRGIDLKKWDETKGIWEASYKYTTVLANGESQRTLGTFYMFALEQFNRDQQLIDEIIATSPSPIIAASRLSETFQEYYGFDFVEYIALLKQINNKENNYFKNYIAYLDNVSNNLVTQALHKGVNNSSVTKGTQLCAVKNLEDLNKLINKTREKIYDIIANTEDATELADKLYVIKINNLVANELLLNDEVLSLVFKEIRSPEGLGALLKKIVSDYKARNSEADSRIYNAAETLLRAAEVYYNVQTLYNNIAAMILPEIKGISDRDFKRYILDQIMGEKRTIAELLDDFDGAMISLQNGLNAMLFDKKFNYADYPMLTASNNPIAKAYREFLEQQQKAGAKYTNEIVIDNITNSTQTLIECLPELADSFEILTNASFIMRKILSDVKKLNEEIASYTLANSKTIFNTINIRQLADVGLAVKVVADSKYLIYFNIPEGLDSATYKMLNDTGKRIYVTQQKALQYSNVLLENRYSIDLAYNVLQQMASQLADQTLNPFKYLSPVVGSFLEKGPQAAKVAAQKYAQIVVFLQQPLDKNLRKSFTEALYNTLLQSFEITTALGDKVVVHANPILHRGLFKPQELLRTDFAWDAMAQGDWLKQARFGDEVVNSIGMYDNLIESSEKITGDFEAVKNELSVNKADRPKMLQQERYIKATKEVQETFNAFKKYYDGLFNRTLAENEIEMCNKVLLHIPSSDVQEFAPLIDDLQRYWRGELTFNQLPKYADDTGGEFQIFWAKIKEMNIVLQGRVKEYNETVTESFKARYKHFDKTEFNSLRKSFSKDELYARGYKKYNEEDFKKYWLKKFPLEPESKKEFVRKAYYKDLRQNNDQVYQAYITELKQYNDSVYDTYIKNLDEYNAKVHQEYKEELLEYTPVTPWDPVRDQQKLNNTIRQATDRNAKNTLYHLFDMSPEELTVELAYRHRFITFLDSDVSSDALKYSFARLQNNLPDCIKHVKEEITDINNKKQIRHWLVLDKSQNLQMDGKQVYLNGEPVTRKITKKQFNEFQIVDSFIEGKPIKPQE